MQPTTQKADIKVVRPFYRSGEVQKKDTTLRGIPMVEALGYVGSGKAVFVNAGPEQAFQPSVPTSKEKGAK